jgi:hypothetical protein
MTTSPLARPDGSPVASSEIGPPVGPGDRHVVRLPLGATCALWAVATASGGVGAWQMAVLNGRAAADGPLWTIASLGGHPQVVATLAAFCVATLLGFAPVTGGLTEADRPLLGPVTVATVAGAVSLLGVVAIVALVLVLVAAALATVATLLDRS